jgi:hypothetical protein
MTQVQSGSGHFMGFVGELHPTKLSSPPLLVLGLVLVLPVPSELLFELLLRLSFRIVDFSDILCFFCWGCCDDGESTKCSPTCDGRTSLGKQSKQMGH